MNTERAPSFEKQQDSTDIARRVMGSSFDEFRDGLTARAHGAVSTLRERRPLYLVADCASNPMATNEFVKDFLADCLDLQLHESELVTSLRLDNFNDQVTQSIIDDKNRPVILPILIGPGENPAWWVGPLWMFYSPGNVHAFRQQLKTEALRLAGDSE